MLKGIVNIHPLSSIIYIVPKSSSCYKYLVGSDVFGESWEMGLTRLLLRDAAVEWNQFLRAMTALHTETIDAKRNSVNSSSINHDTHIVQSTQSHFTKFWLWTLCILWMIVDEFTLFLLASLVSVCNAVIARRNRFHSTAAPRNHNRVKPFFYQKCQKTVFTAQMFLQIAWFWSQK